MRQTATGSVSVAMYIASFLQELLLIIQACCVLFPGRSAATISCAETRQTTPFSLVPAHAQPDTRTVSLPSVRPFLGDIPRPCQTTLAWQAWHDPFAFDENRPGERAHQPYVWLKKLSSTQTKSTPVLPLSTTANWLSCTLKPPKMRVPWAISTWAEFGASCPALKLHS